MLTDAERRTLLTIAREAMTARVVAQAYAPPRGDGALARPQGAFVTLRCDAMLRGCVGYTESAEPLAEIVARCAAAAATEDPRFSPLSEGELHDVVLEVSVLGPIEPLGDPGHLELGHDGLIVEEGPRRGLLLPQVATERGWDRPTFLTQTCVKAGLKPDAWKSGARLFTFQAEVFAEGDYVGTEPRRD